MNLQNFFLMGNRLYERTYPLYKPLYFAYKTLCERDTIRVLKRYVRPGMTALDIGANIGFYSLMLSRLVAKNGVVHCFEPDRMNFLRLGRTLSRCSNTVAIRAAVGERSGHGTLYVSSRMNTDHRMYDDGEERKAVAVDCIAIDDYLRQGEKVDFIKMDIQGFEYHALMGMQQTIRRSPGIVLLSELWPFGLLKAGVDPAGIVTLLASHGFSVKILGLRKENDWLSKKADPQFFTNLLAIRK